MNNITITKNLLSGYIFIVLIGLGCFGFVFINFLSNTNAVVTATGTTSFLLLAVYLVVAFTHIRKKLSQEVQNSKQSLILLIILSLATVILFVLFFLFRNSISLFFTEKPGILKTIISILFVISMAQVVLKVFRNRK